MKKICLAILSIASCAAAVAQSNLLTCSISLQYEPVSSQAINSVAVPTVTSYLLLALSALIGTAAWRLRTSKGARFLSFIALAICLSATFPILNHSFIGSVNASNPLEFNDSNGGAVEVGSVVAGNDSLLFPIVNNSGNSIKITSNGNSNEAGTCTVGTVVSNQQSCTAQVSNCTPVLAVIEIEEDPVVACSRDIIGSYRYYREPHDNDYEFEVFAPMEVQSAVFNPGSVATEFSYERNAIVPVYDPTTYAITNLAEISSGVVTVRATANPGYMFDNNEFGVYDFTLDYAACHNVRP